MQKYLWSRLNKQQVGMFTEYFVKMDLTMYGFQVYGTEVDDRGIDFVARYESRPFIEIQVKAIRSNNNYVFMEKSKFDLVEHRYLALGILTENEPPLLYLIPSTAWLIPGLGFVSRDYEGLKSKPEWGLNISKKHRPALQSYLFESSVELLMNP